MSHVTKKQKAEKLRSHLAAVVALIQQKSTEPPVAKMHEMSKDQRRKAWINQRGHVNGLTRKAEFLRRKLLGLEDK